mgnify:CR=1 FL=1
MNVFCRPPTAELCAELSAHGFTDLGILSRGVDTGQFSPARRSPELRAAWGAAPYQPTPTIIEAAQALYSRHTVAEISRSDAGATNLTLTADGKPSAHFEHTIVVRPGGAEILTK